MDSFGEKRGKTVSLQQQQLPRCNELRLVCRQSGAKHFATRPHCETVVAAECGTRQSRTGIFRALIYQPVINPGIVHWDTQHGQVQSSVEQFSLF